jgi:hypothetical protein
MLDRRTALRSVGRARENSAQSLRPVKSLLALSGWDGSAHGLVLVIKRTYRMA